VKKYLPFIILIVLLGIMTATNPGENHFKSFVKEQLSKKQFTQKDLENNLTCEKTGNYIIFSQYSFQINDYGVPMSGNYIGMFGFFFSVGNYTTMQDQ